MLANGGFLFLSHGFNAFYKGASGMKYTKPFLSFEEQVTLLQSRGMAGTAEEIQRCLHAVNYYRLTAYWHPFKDRNDQFFPNTHINTVWRRYRFDRELRLLMMDAIERVEISLRCIIAYKLAKTSGPFGYLEEIYRDNLRGKKIFERKLTQALHNSPQDFARHFRDKYGDKHELPPIWIAVELLTFGSLAHLFKACSPKVRKNVGEHFDLSWRIVDSWMWTLKEVRNIAAHHERMWNRQFGNSALHPRGHRGKAWENIPRNQSFGIISILAYFMNRIAPQSAWFERIQTLFEGYPEIPVDSMAIPSTWQVSSLAENLRALQ